MMGDPRASFGLLLVALLSFAPLPALASDPVVIDEGLETVILGEHLAVLEDSSGRLTVADVAAPDVAPRFRSLGSDETSLGYSDSVYWVRFDVDNRTGEEAQWYLELAYEVLEDVRFFAPDGQGGFQEHRSGTAVPVREREIQYRTFVIPVTEAPGSHTYYVRLQSRSALNLDVYLHSPSAFTRRTT